MARILILGGTGLTGKLIARHLLEASGAQVTIATRHPGKAQAFTEALNREHSGNRAGAVYADAADAASLRAAFREHTLVVVAAPTTAHAEEVVRAALEESVDYLDVQLGARKLALLRSVAPEIEGAGRCFVTEAGFHPGLPAVLVRLAATRLESVERAITACYLNMGKDLPYTEAVDELMEAFKDYQGQVFRDGGWTRPGSWAVREVDFGGDIGRRRCYSMFLEEMRPLPEVLPSLKETGFFISETHWMTDRVITPIVWMGLKLAPGAVRPLGRLFWWSMGTFHRPPYRVELQVRATGIRDGKPATFQARVAHPDGYELTAIPVVAALLQYLDGSARKPGLWMMGHLVEPTRLMRDMGAMGLEVAVDGARGP